jgi:hypothetical protein
MTWDEKEDNTIYKVVVNHEEQYYGRLTGRILSVGGTRARVEPRPNAWPT